MFFLLKISIQIHEAEAREESAEKHTELRNTAYFK